VEKAGARGLVIAQKAPSEPTCSLLVAIYALKIYGLVCGKVDNYDNYVLYSRAIKLC